MLNFRNTEAFVFHHSAEHFVKGKSKFAEKDQEVSDYNILMPVLPTKGHNFEDTGVRQGHALFNMTNALLNITNALLNMTNALLNMANDLLTITNDLLIDQRSAQYVRPFI